MRRCIGLVLISGHIFILGLCAPIVCAAQSWLGALGNALISAVQESREKPVQLNQSEIDQLRSEVNLDSEITRSLPYEPVAGVAATLCVASNAASGSSDSPSNDDINDQLRYKAKALGANGLANVAYQPLPADNATCVRGTATAIKFNIESCGCTDENVRKSGVNRNPPSVGSFYTADFNQKDASDGNDMLALQLTDHCRFTFYVPNMNNQIPTYGINDFIASGNTLILPLKVMQRKDQCDSILYTASLGKISPNDLKLFVAQKRKAEEEEKARIAMEQQKEDELREAIKRRQTAIERQKDQALIKKWIAKGAPAHLLIAKIQFYNGMQYIPIFDWVVRDDVTYRIVDFAERLKGKRVFIRSGNMWVLQQKWTDEMTGRTRDYRYGFNSSGTLSRIVADGFELPVSSEVTYKEIRKAMEN